MNAGLPTQRSFDISQEKDLIALLREVRHSPLSPEEKDEVRDAVFTLSTTKNSILLRGVKETLATVGIAIILEQGKRADDQSAPLSVAAPHQSKRPRHAIGQTRKIPSFVVASSSKPLSTTTQEAMSGSQETREEGALNIEIPTKTDVTHDGVEAISQSAHHSLTPEPSSASRMTSEAALARIKEIKQHVNSVVGNPVNLIAKNEAVGKEYMATLLEAMRVASADGDVATAMKKLEAVNKDVEAVLAAKESEPPANQASASEPTSHSVNINRIHTPPSPEAAEPEPAIVREVVREEEAPDTLSSLKDHLPNEAPSVVTPRSSGDQFSPSTVAEVSSSVSTPPTPPLQNDAVSESEIAQVLEDAERVLETAVAADGGEESSLPPSSVSVPPAVPTERMTPPSAASNAPEASRWGVSSFSSEKGNAVPFKKITTEVVTPLATDRFQSVTSAPSAIEKQRQVLEQYKQQQREHDINDPLHSEEVQQGLSMLLLEWELFRKSGLLGTGPKGLEHPLYKKMAPLKMNLVISGRFEGATPEVRQSIIDYMNGWRYEHGIVHEMDETFEHYLRRVIATILTKQKQHA